jgi:hypothetical protein
MTSKKRMPTLKGIIIPSRWDEDGNIKEVSLHTSDEKEYRVEYGMVGKELLTLIHQKVEASGKIHSYMPLGDSFGEKTVQT